MRIFSNQQIIILLFIVMSILIVIRRNESEGMQNYIDETTGILPGDGITSNNGQSRLDFGIDGGLKIVRILDTEGKIETKWIYNPEDNKMNNPIFQFENGKLSILNDNYDVKWTNNVKNGGAGCKLIMDDDGVLKIRNKLDVIIWQYPGIGEGFTSVSGSYIDFEADYYNRIKNPRKELNEKVERLQSLPRQSNLQKNAYTMRYILWATLALSMFLYLLFGS